MIRRPPRSTLDRSSAASDVYKRQDRDFVKAVDHCEEHELAHHVGRGGDGGDDEDAHAVSYTHLRAHETVLDLVCRLLLEKKKQPIYEAASTHRSHYKRTNTRQTTATCVTR